MLKEMLIAGLVLTGSATPVETTPTEQPPIVEVEPSVPEEKPVEPEKPNLEEDKDGNGIPDVIEDYYDKNIRDKYMFGISLGAVIAFLTSVVGYMFIAIKNSKSNKRAEKTNSNINAKLERLENENQAYRQATADMQKTQIELVKHTQEIVNDAISNDRKMRETLSQFSRFDDKVNTILENQKVMATTDECVKKGISTEIAENVKEVR